MLMRKQWDNVYLTVEIDIEAVCAFFCSTESNLSRPEPCSKQRLK